MKIHQLLPAFFFFLSYFSFAQYSAIERIVIDQSEVPEMVLDAQLKQFKSGFVTQWKVHNQDVAVNNDLTYYMSTFKKDGRLGNYAYYTPKGELLAYSLFINAKDLPEYIRYQITSEMNGWFIKSAEIIDLENPHRYIYRVRMNKDGLLKYRYFDGNGEPLAKEKLPIEIFAFI